jgi:hypothetical protein
MLKFLDGYKTYLAGVGLIGLGLYQVSIGHLEQAGQSFLAGLAAFGLRSAIAKQSPPAE